MNSGKVWWKKYLRYAGRPVLCMMIIFMMVSIAFITSAKGPKPTPTNRYLDVAIYRIVDIDGADNLSPGDFYWKITVSAGTYEETQMSALPYATNTWDLFPKKYPAGSIFEDCPWYARFNVPDDKTSFSVNIELWDDDDITADQLCDLSGPLDSDVDLMFDTVTRTWSGDDYIGDPNGYGHVNGEQEDGSYATDQRDAEMWFSIMDVMNALGGSISVTVYDENGVRLPYAQVEVWVWIDNCDSPPDQGFLIISGTTDSNGIYSDYFGSLVTTLTFWIKKDGYWEERVDFTSWYETGVYNPKAYLPANEETWVTQLAMFAHVNFDQTLVTYMYSSGHTSTFKADAYAGGFGTTTSVDHTVGVCNSVNSDTYALYHDGTYPTSHVRQKLGTTSGIFSGALEYFGPLHDSSLLDAWLCPDLEPMYQTNSEMPDYWVGSYKSGCWTERVYAGQEFTVTRTDSGSVTLQAGLSISISTGVPGFSVSTSLVCTLADTESSVETLSITLFNRDSATSYHDYLCWLENGVILHIWQL